MMVLFKVTLFFVFTTLTFASPGSGKIYFEGNNDTIEAQRATIKPHQNETPHLPNRVLEAPAPPSASSVHAPPSASSVQDPSEIKAQKFITQGVTKLAIELQRILGNGKENVIIAPVSISAALALCLLGSKGKTADEIANLLGVFTGVELSTRKEIVHQKLGKFFNVLESGTDHLITQAQLTFASGVFVQEGFPINPMYEEIAKNVYRSEVLPLNFKLRGNEASEIINKWVENRTEGRIKNIVENGLSPANRAVIVNAIYFNGEWEHPFSELHQRYMFYTSKNHAVNVTMMNLVEELPYYFDKERGFKMFGLPYKGGELLMYILVPTGDLDHLLQSLSADSLNEMIDNCNVGKLILIMPKFKLERSTDLREPLQRLGVRTIFNPVHADMSGLSPGVFAGEVVHKVEIEVTETGTSASAATLVSLRRDGSTPFARVDKPFLFVIYHKSTRTVIFWGSIYDPTS